MSLSRRGLLEVSLLGAGALTLAGTQKLEAQSPTPSSPMLNAADFGLQPNLRVDQTRILGTAIFRARRAGKALYIPAGRYFISNLTIKGPTEIYGVEGATIFDFSGGMRFIRIEKTRNVTLSSLIFNGTNRALKEGGRSGLVSANNVDNLTITKCRFNNSLINGLTLRTCSGRVENCEISKISNAGIFSLNAKKLQIDHCHIKDCGNNGIQIWRAKPGADGTQITNNHIERIRANAGGSGQYGNGVNIFRAGNVLVGHNRIDRCAFSAVRSNAGSACQIIGNNCTRLDEVAIYAEFGFEGAIITGNFIQKAASGISITNFNEGGRMGICAQNIVRDLFVGDHPEPRGIGISAEADSVVEGNVVENAASIGISIGWGRYLRDVVVTNNVIRKSGTGIGVTVMQGAGKALIANNLISGSAKAGIAGYNHRKLVVPDLAKAKDRFTNLQISGNLIT